MDQYLIFNYDARPKRLHIKLNKLKRNKKFEFDYMPTLKQIQDFINNRKKKIGDENNLDELETFVDGLKYSEGITKDDDTLSASTMAMAAIWNIFSSV